MRLYNNNTCLAGHIYDVSDLCSYKMLLDCDQQITIVYHYHMDGICNTETDVVIHLVRDCLWANGKLVAQIDQDTHTGALRYMYPAHLTDSRSREEDGIACTVRRTRLACILMIKAGCRITQTTMAIASCIESHCLESHEGHCFI